MTEVSLLSALEPCRQFLTSEAGPTGLRFQIYHYSFRVFLQGNEEIGGELARTKVFERLVRLKLLNSWP